MKANPLPFLLCTLISISIALHDANAQRVIYVYQQATGNNTGQSFEDAYVYLQDALEDAQAGDEVRVYPGIYRPDQGQNVALFDRHASFVIKKDVRVLSGYDPGRPFSSQRDTEEHRVILTGDLRQNDNGLVELDEPTRSDNSIHVVTIHPGTNTATTLDGFMIRAGHADTLSQDTGSGAGLLVLREENSSLRLANLKFLENFSAQEGGALANYGGPLWLSNVYFVRNQAVEAGGALLHRPPHRDNAVNLRNATFMFNKTEHYGGALQLLGDIIVNDAIFLGNEALIGGVAMHLSHDAFYANVSFLGNKASSVGGVFCNENSDASITIFNSVFSGNEANAALGMYPDSRTRGGAIINNGSELRIYQSTLVNNKASAAGAISLGGFVGLYNSIIKDNHSKNAGEENFTYNPDHVRMEMDHNLIDQELPDEFFDYGGNQLLFIEDVGAQPIFVDPLGPDGIAGTLDDDLRLLPNSPAIDAGKNVLLPPDTFDLDNDGDTTEPVPLDLDHNQRILAGAQSGFHVDLGAYEYVAPAPIAERPKNGPGCPGDALAPAYPNPFANNTQLEMCVSRTGQVEVAIYDILGRRKATVFEGVLEAHQRYPVVIESTGLSSGVYFVKLKHPHASAIQSVVLTP